MKRTSLVFVKVKIILRSIIISLFKTLKKDMAKNIFSIVAFFFSIFILLPAVLVFSFSDNLLKGSKSLSAVLHSDNYGYSTLNFKMPEYVLVYRNDAKENNKIPLEDYVFGVLASEMPSSFEVEALKAQAVAARTYAVAKLDVQGLLAVDNLLWSSMSTVGPTVHPTAPLCDTTHCQVYHSPDELSKIKGEYWSAFLDISSPVNKTLSITPNASPQQPEILSSDNGSNFSSDARKIAYAVDSTKGEVMLYNGQLVSQALFHSSSGGKTENSEDVFASAIPYLRSVPSTYEDDASHKREITTLTYTSLTEALNSKYPNKSTQNVNKNTVKVLSNTEGGGVDIIKIGTEEYTGRQLREALSLYSSAFNVTCGENAVSFVSTGYGHRVGMSQYGANGMAKAGYSYTDILSHYYTGITVGR